MVWMRYDDDFPDHPKVVKGGPLAAWLHVCGIGYCNRQLTDGFVPHDVAVRLVNLNGILLANSKPGEGDPVTCEMLIERLLATGMCHEADGGYRIHDYLSYQPSRKEVLRNRRKTLARVKRYRLRKRNAVTPPTCNGGCNALPVPVPGIKRERTAPSASSGAAPATKTRKTDGKVPPGYGEAVDYWFTEFERARGAKPQFDQAEGPASRSFSGPTPSSR